MSFVNEYGECNLYDCLGLTRDTNNDDLTKAFKKAALKHHPDKGGDAEKFKTCNQAFQILSDAKQRADYDQVKKKN
jgi:DnaJ-class molecular chaperone